MNRKVTRTAQVRAFAKLNLGLRVLYRRPDGYHELRTVFQTISLADRIGIAYAPARTTRIEINGTPEIPDNLVEKAARIAMEAMRIHGDISFTLKKNIPSGAGLGGGSSDAAAVLLALPVLAGKTIPPAQLRELAATLGSDVPFFLHGGTALGLGRGEELYPLPDAPRAKGLLIAPDIHSSTAEAYRDLSSGLTSIPLQNKLNSFQQEIWRGVTAGASVRPVVRIDENDFEAVVFARYPELGKIREKLSRLGGNPAAMTGSGSAIFGLFADSEKLERARRYFADKTVFPISFVSGAQYRTAWRRALRLHVEGNQWPLQSRYARNLSAR